MINFLISGYGRSGTKWLSSLMNRSNIWEVQHEPGGPSDERRMVEKDRLVPKSIQERFNSDNYGEVNSRLRWIVDKIDVEKRGVIIRDPIDIWASTFKRKKGFYNYNDKQLENEAGRILQSFQLFQRISPHLDRIISFRQMTSNVNYTQELLEFFGVMDVSVTEEDISNKKNASKNREVPDGCKNKRFMKYIHHARDAAKYLSDL
jgi:hypothetical protein